MPPNINHLLKSITDHKDQRAFKVLFDIYYARLLRFACFWTASHPLAEEVVSEVFLKLWNQKGINQIKNLDSYLFIATKRQALNYIRNEKRNQHTALLTNHHQIIFAYQNPENALLDHELNECVWEAIENLPPRCKMIFSLVRQDGLPYKEVAKLIEVSVKTVENQVAKATMKIREAIDRYNIAPQPASHHWMKVAKILALITISVSI